MDDNDIPIDDPGDFNDPIYGDPQDPIYNPGSFIDPTDPDTPGEPIANPGEDPTGGGVGGGMPNLPGLPGGGGGGGGMPPWLQQLIQSGPKGEVPSLIRALMGGLGPAIGMMGAGAGLPSGTTNQHQTQNGSFNNNTNTNQSQNSNFNQNTNTQTGGSFNQNTAQNGSFAQQQQGGGAFTQQQQGGGTMAQNSVGGGSMNQSSAGGGSMSQNQTGGGAFSQNQTGGGTQNTQSQNTSNFGQAQTGTQTNAQQQASQFQNTGLNNFQSQSDVNLSPFAIQAGGQALQGLQDLMPSAQKGFKKSNSLLQNEGMGLARGQSEGQQNAQQASDLLMKMKGPQVGTFNNIDLNNIDPELVKAVKSSFDPMIGDITEQAINDARSRGFSGGAELLGGPAAQFAGKALANIPGMEAQQLMNMMIQAPLAQSQIGSAQSAANVAAKNAKAGMRAQAGQLGNQTAQTQGGLISQFANQLGQPMQQYIQGNAQLATASPYGTVTHGTQANQQGGQTTANTTGTQENAQNVTGQSSQAGSQQAQNQNYANTAGENTNYANTTGQNTNFNNTSGQNQNYQNTTGQNSNFQNTAGQNTNFSNTTGQNQSNTNTSGQNTGFSNTNQSGSSNSNTNTNVNQSGNSKNTTDTNTQQIPGISSFFGPMGTGIATGLNPQAPNIGDLIQQLIAGARG